MCKCLYKQVKGTFYPKTKQMNSQKIFPVCGGMLVLSHPKKMRCKSRNTPWRIT